MTEKLKSAILTGTVTILAAFSMSVSASPPDGIELNPQPEIIYLTAKIENAISDLRVNRTEADIRNAAITVLAENEFAHTAVQSAVALVIDNAIAIGDMSIANAMKSLLFEPTEMMMVAAPVPVNTDVVADEQPYFPPPPIKSSNGSSDY